LQTQQGPKLSTRSIAGVRPVPPIRKDSGVKPSSPTDLLLPKTPPKGLPDFGATSGFNSAMQLFNAISEFRKGIMESKNHHLCVLWLKEVFKMLNSSAEIPEGRLRELLEGKIFPSLTSRGQRSLTDRKGNTLRPDEIISHCLSGLELGNYYESGKKVEDEAIKEQAVKCFLGKVYSTIQAKFNPGICETTLKEELFIWEIPIKSKPKGKEISGEFMQIFHNFILASTKAEQSTEVDGNKVDNVSYVRIHFPSVFLLSIDRTIWNSDSKNNEKIERPMTIPLEFEMPKEIMADPKLMKLIGGIICQGKTTKDWHYVAYIRTLNGFFRCNDTEVRWVVMERHWKR
jgi:hypothetical protein